MNDAIRRESPWRRVREWAFALCTLWLVVQNTILLFITIRHWPEVLGAVLDTLPKGSFDAPPLWVIPAAAFGGLAIATTLARDASAHRAGRRWEMDHGRTR